MDLLCYMHVNTVVDKFTECSSLFLKAFEKNITQLCLGLHFLCSFCRYNGLLDLRGLCFLANVAVQ